jgi:hypothetical protein
MADKNVESGGTSSKTEKTDKTNAETSCYDELQTSLIYISKERPEDIFHDTTKAWRKQINHVQGKLVNCTEIASLQNDVAFWNSA